jgi:hypothetical protein
VALSAIKTWIAGEILFASDLNAEFANILTNGEDLGTPASKVHDMNGFELVLDADGDTGVLADTDDRIDFRLSGVDLFRWDATVATPVNGIDFVASATTVDVVIRPQGSDANIDLDLRAKGAGGVLIESAPVPFLAQVYSF